MAPLDQFDPDAAAMSFGDHLEELRSRVIKALIVPIPLAVVTYAISGEILQWLILPLERALRAANLPEQLQVLSPAEALLTQIKISLIAALILAAPWVFWQLWQFIRPGLYAQERRFVYFLVPGSAFMTAAGVALLYFVMLPLVLMVLVNFGTVLDDELDLQSLKVATSQTTDVGAETDAPPPARIPLLNVPPAEPKVGDMWLTQDNDLMIVVPGERGGGDQTTGAAPPLSIRRIPLPRSASIAQQFQLSTYVSFVLILALGMAIAFQTPLVMLLLGWLDLVRVDWLRRNRRYALFGAAVLGAILTPADPWSMVAMMAPLYLLYELGIILMVLFPASRVAGGEVFGRGGSDKTSTYPDPSEQPDSTDEITRRDSGRESRPDSESDDEGTA